MLYTILKHNCTELEVAVCVKNISKLFVKCLYDAGIEALACAHLLHLRLRLVTRTKAIKYSLALQVLNAKKLDILSLTKRV